MSFCRRTNYMHISVSKLGSGTIVEILGFGEVRQHFNIISMIKIKHNF